MGMPSEYPITQEQMDLMADEALGPDPEELEAQKLGTLDELQDGPGYDTGARQSHKEIARRQRLLAGAPNVRDALSSRRKKAFLKALATTGNVVAASAAAGWGKNIAYSVRKADPDFLQSWEYAIETYCSRLELEADRRAVTGVEKGVYGSLGKDQGSGLIGTETVYSDGLLQTLLKANMRNKYGDKSEVDVTSKGGVLVVPAAPSVPDWEAQASAGQKQFREGGQED